MSYTLIIDVCGVRISMLSLAREDPNTRSNPKTVSKSQIKICINNYSLLAYRENQNAMFRNIFELKTKNFESKLYQFLYLFLFKSASRVHLNDIPNVSKTLRSATFRFFNSVSLLVYSCVK